MAVIASMTNIVQELTSLGIPLEVANAQVELLKRGTRFAAVQRSAAIGDGIVQLSDSEVEAALEAYDRRDDKVKILKFVPASGAATRMFKDLSSFLQTGIKNASAQHFFEHLDQIAFNDLLRAGKRPLELTEHMLGDKGLNLDDLPKGSIPFHRYGDGFRTAFEEHLVEGVSYALTDRKVHIHFTIAPDHMQKVKEDMSQWTIEYGDRLGVEYDLQFSVQADTTDTMCLDLESNALRRDDGSLILRPGGHGALIHNLNVLDADIIFIKNVDNVVPDAHREATIRYKKALGGLLIQVRREARELIEELKTGGQGEEALDFLRKMGIALDDKTPTEELIQLMNRPYRVCGMVRNEGEPGGGPFWVKSGKNESLQIVESAQIDLKEDKYREMLDEGTHFNPVDLVCCLNDLYGKRQDLLEFVDMDSAFVTEKTVEGKSARVLEWPGLWNGAMAHWNSLFVEVPISTFNPVKTVNDLLRPMHQPS